MKYEFLKFVILRELCPVCYNIRLDWLPFLIWYNANYRKKFYAMNSIWAHNIIARVLFFSKALKNYPIRLHSKTEQQNNQVIPWITTAGKNQNVLSKLNNGSVRSMFLRPEFPFSVFQEWKLCLYVESYEMIIFIFAGMQILKFHLRFLAIWIQIKNPNDAHFVVGYVLCKRWINSHWNI